MNAFLKHKVNTKRYLEKRLEALDRKRCFLANEWYLSYRDEVFPEYRAAVADEYKRVENKMRWYSRKYIASVTKEFWDNMLNTVATIRLGRFFIKLHK